MTITLFELYPATLSLNGDVGNRTALTTRASLAGLEMSQHSYDLGDIVPSVTPDIILIGSGTSSAVRLVATDIGQLSAWIRLAVEEGATLIAVGAGFSLMTNTVQIAENERINGVGIFDATTDATVSRVITEGFTFDTGYGRIVGTENHTTIVTLAESQAAFGPVRFGRGNGNGYEGAVTKNAIGTHCHGPFLPMNPSVTDAVLAQVSSRTGEEYVQTLEHQKLDDLTRLTRNILLTKAGLSE